PRFHSFPTRRSSDLIPAVQVRLLVARADVRPSVWYRVIHPPAAEVHPHLLGALFDRRLLDRPEVDLREVERAGAPWVERRQLDRSEEHTSELQSLAY